MGKTAIIGDVHGMTDMLVALVAKLDLQAGDTLVSVGDLVDKGPDPAGTVAYARALAEQAAFDVVLVEANHEDRHIRYRRNLTVRPKIARQQAASAPELPDLMERLTEAILLKNSALNRSNSDSLVFVTSEEISDDGTVRRERCQAVL